MKFRYLLPAMLLATTSTAALACPDCAGDYAAWLEDQGQAANEEATKQAFQEYEAQKMADAKAAFLNKFKSGTTDDAAKKGEVIKVSAKSMPE